ncbi:hypothetical protein STENM223S_08440 [Streptomyces tendae]
MTVAQQLRHRAVGTRGPFPVVGSGNRRGIGGVADGRGPLGLQGGDGGADRGADTGVHALDLSQR